MIGSLRFAGNLHPILVIGFALISALVVAWIYLRETKSFAAPASYILPGLRGTTVALSILILSGPVWHRRQTIGTLGHVIFAVDQSKSMSVTDSIASDSSPSRLTRATRLLIGTDSATGWLDQLRSTHSLDVVGFSSGDPIHIWSSGGEAELPLSLDLTADGTLTDLASAMLMGDISDTSQPPTAVVLMTEGRDNAGSSPTNVAARLKSLGARIHAIGIGSPDEPNNITITRVNHPATTAADAPLIGSISIRQSGFTGTDSVVEIKHQGETLWQQAFTPSATESKVPFEINVADIVDRMSAAAPRGVQRSIAVIDLQASVQPSQGENWSTDSSRSFRVAASTSDHRLLIVDGSSRWEMRYVKNLFSRDPEWSVDTLLFGAGTDNTTIVRGDQVDQFPDSNEAIGRYDAIVLGELPPDQWTQADGELLREFVSRGGGLIVIDGRYERVKTLVQESLADLVPVTYSDLAPVTVRSIKPTRLAENDRKFELWSVPARRTEFWERLPAPARAPDIAAQVGADVLANVISTDNRSVPWMVTRLFGAGRVIYLSTDQTWRWRYKVADRFHSQFWNQLMVSVTQPPYSVGDSFVALGTDKIEYNTGETASIRARLRNATGQPIGNSTVEALLLSNNDIVARIPLEADDPARGTYRGISGPLESGDYSVRIRASGISQDALQATTPIWVDDRDTGEMTRISLDSPYLQQITDNGGGTYVHESEADRIIDQLAPLSSGQIVESDIVIWQSFYWFFIILILLTAEWVMRKRIGLI